jgi:2-isopropylmalate synthase
MFNLVKDVRENVPNIHKAQISVHCHNDLGLGVANSLYAVMAGADQVECTMNGIGERAGNASLEEIVMALATRRDYYNAITRLDTTQIMKASKLLTSITGVAVQPNKAIVGANAFSHEAGIHQHGMLENRSTYEIMTPESVGLNVSKMVLGKHSGRHAFKDRIVSLGYELSDEDIDAAFKEFKILADKKKQVFDEDIVSIIERDDQNDQEFTLEKFDIVSRKGRPSEATVWVRKQNETMEAVENGDGPVDASFKAVEKIVGKEIELLDYTLHSITEGQDAMGKATVKVQAGEYTYNGKGVSTDVVEASIKAFIDAINKSMKNGKKHEERMTV